MIPRGNFCYLHFLASLYGVQIVHYVLQINSQLETKLVKDDEVHQQLFMFLNNCLKNNGLFFPHNCKQIYGKMTSEDFITSNNMREIN